jgi:glycerate kinase
MNFLLNFQRQVLACTDKFKDSLGALQVGEAVIRTLKRHFPNIVSHNLPLSDGGDGFIQAIALTSSGSSARRIHINKATVTGPLGVPVESDYGLVTSGNETEFAVIEMAKTSGLELVPVEKRNPNNTTTKGLGELIMVC